MAGSALQLYTLALLACVQSCMVYDFYGKQEAYETVRGLPRKRREPSGGLVKGERDVLSQLQFFILSRFFLGRNHAIPDHFQHIGHDFRVKLGAGAVF